MADPTQPLRSKLAGAIPSNSPLGQSMATAKLKEEEQLAADEANNYVMQREPVNLPPEAQEFVDPNIPITQPEAERQPAQALETPATPAQVPQAQFTNADAGFDALAKQMDTLQKQVSEDLKQRKSFALEKRAEIEKEIAKINQNPIQLDNRSLWAKSSTGQKIVLALGALLSSADPNSARAFQQGVQTTIENDIKAQMDAINAQREDKKSLLSQYKQITGDYESAADALRAHAYAAIQSKLQIQSQKAQSRLQREQAMVNADLAGQQKMIELAKLQEKLKTTQEEGSIPGFTGQIKDQVAARDFRKVVAEKPQVINEIDNLLNINKQFLGGALSPSARASAEQSQNLLIGKLREAIVGPGTLSETDRNLLEKAIANPTDFFSLGSSNKIRLEKLKQSYNNAIRTKAESLGLRPEGVPASFKPKGA